MAKNNLIIKTETGVPSWSEIQDFEIKRNISINEAQRLYSSFKVGKRRKIKRLYIKVTKRPCELCGMHVWMSGKIGNQEFQKDIF